MKKSHIAGGATGPSQRQLRVGELVRHALADVLTQGLIHDEALVGVVVTVPEVRMTPDLRTATAYVVPLGGKGGEAIIAAFERNTRFLRGEVAHRVDLRFAPELKFRLDTSFDEGQRIDALLKRPEVARDTARPEDAPPGGEADDQ